MIFGQFRHSFDNAPVRSADLHISALGFEDRCTALIRNGLVTPKNAIFLQFPETDLFAYLYNQALVSKMSNTRFIRISDQEFLTTLRQAIDSIPATSITIDISSMNRTMIAAVFSCLMNLDSRYKLEVLYVPAQYSNPSPEFSEIEAAGPVLPEFSAFDDASDYPTSIIVGLGFEYGIALGLINRIEPRNTICLYATGHDHRFDKAVRRANLDFKFPGISATTLSYDMFNPEQTYNYLSSTIRNLKTRYRISLIPLGPKILSSLFALVSIEFLGEVTLWRVVKNSEQMNAVEDNEIVGYQIETSVLQKSKARFENMIGA